VQAEAILEPSAPREDASTDLLRVEGLTTAYRGLIAISDVSVSVRAKEIVTVAGANGAGKSTLLKTIAGMERARSGRIFFMGRPIHDLPGHEIAALGLSYLPENKRLFPRLTVADNLRLGSYLFRGRADRDAPLATVFQLFPRLEERLQQRAGTLSGGEQQMLAISRALMTRPRLLMLDEPSQGIMPKLVDEIFEAIELIRATGVTVLLVEQRLAESLAIADRAYVLQTGRVTLEGTAREIGEDPGVRKAYLGM
jgi:branched-chain amino acid transport system ATP-binding protein